jgi:hypothetical protein
MAFEAGIDPVIPALALKRMVSVMTAVPSRFMALPPATSTT